MKRLLVLNVILIVALALAASCALFRKNPTPGEQQTAKQQTADVVNRLTFAVKLADNVMTQLQTSSFSPQLKIEIGCAALKAVGTDAPTPTLTKECGQLPTRATAPLQVAVDAAQALASCASRNNTIAVALAVTEPIWTRLEQAKETALQLLGAGLRFAMQGIPRPTCGGVA